VACVLLPGRLLLAAITFAQEFHNLWSRPDSCCECNNSYEEDEPERPNDGRRVCDEHFCFLQFRTYRTALYVTAIERIPVPMMKGMYIYGRYSRTPTFNKINTMPMSIALNARRLDAPGSTRTITPPIIQIPPTNDKIERLLIESGLIASVNCAAPGTDVGIECLAGKQEQRSKGRRTKKVFITKA